MKTNYTVEQLIDKFNALTKKETINVLYDALDFMQQHNGRSKFDCIFMAMGFENYEGEYDTWTKA